ncbi:MAG: hypothetical protein KAS04_01815 [Candidatus Aenigmarchaeota archaeon]|nr:hypothetical protein [Candidatus Aenigmarchaeota archaeon]
MFEIGRICMKTAGREAGKFCVVIGKKEDDFVTVTGPRIVTDVRRRKCNVRHLEPVPVKINVKDGATDTEVMNAYEKDKVYEKLKLVKPTAEDMKLAEEAAARHKEKVSEKPKKEHKKAEHKKEEHKTGKKEEKPKEHRKIDHKVEKKKVEHKKKEAPKKKPAAKKATKKKAKK